MFYQTKKQTTQLPVALVTSLSFSLSLISSMAQAKPIAESNATAGPASAEVSTTVEDIVISGSRSASKLSETPQAIGVVREEILKRDKPKTMGEVINRIAGVYWNDLGNEQHSMSIRQPVSTNAVYQYLEDGIPIRPLGVFNHNSLNEMNLAGSERVEVVKGAASSLYGSNAVGGAVNFLTARPSETPVASIGLRYDQTAGFKRIDTAASNSWGDLGLKLSHYSSRRSADNWQEYSNGAKDSVTLRGDYVLSSKALLRASIVHTDLDAAMAGGLNETDYQRSSSSDIVKSINTFTYRKDKTSRMNLALDADTIHNGVTTVTLFQRANDHGQIPSYTMVNCSGKATVCQGTINNSHVDSLGLDLKHQQNFDWLNARLVTGVYLDHSDNPYFSNNLNVVRDPLSGKNLSYSLANASNPKGVRDYQTDIVNNAFFAQLELSPIPAMRLVAGVRSDSIRYSYTNNLNAAGSANYGAANETRTFSHVSPKLGATFALSKESSMYANFSEGFTPPEVSQLYGKTGIPNLSPATYVNQELGLRMAFLDGALKLDSALYRLNGRDTIVSYTIAQGVSENRNAGRTSSEGIELALNYDTQWFDARFGGSIARHRYDKYQVSATLDYSGKDMPQAPHQIISAEVGIKPTEHSRIALEIVKQGDYWMNNANTVRYAGHKLMNLRASLQLKKGVDLWVQGRNLGNVHYADSASSSYAGTGTYTPDTQNSYTLGAPRSFMLGINYTIGK